MNATEGIAPRALAASLALALGAAACSPEPPDPAAEVRAVVEGMIEAIEENDPHAILEHVAPEFRSEDGLTYPDVQSIVLEYLLGEHRLGARLELGSFEPGEEPGEIRVRARVRFARGARLSDRQGPPILPSVVYLFDVRFRSFEGVWQASGGSYRRSQDAGSEASTTPRDRPTRSSVPGRACSGLT
jgi:hypothetical protein